MDDEGQGPMPAPPAGPADSGFDPFPPDARPGPPRRPVRQRMLIGAVVAIVVAGTAIGIGIGIVASYDSSRDDSTSEDSSDSPVTYGTPTGLVGPSFEDGDHWHAAYGVNLCGIWQPVVPEYESTVGLHSHGDGLFHIHPYTEAGSFENATVEHLLDPPPVEQPVGVSEEPTLRYELDPDRITASGTRLVVLGPADDDPSETSVDAATFVDGDACPNLGGREGALRWAVARYDPALGDYTQGPVEQEGDLAT